MDEFNLNKFQCIEHLTKASLLRSTLNQLKTAYIEGLLEDKNFSQCQLTKIA